MVYAQISNGARFVKYLFSATINLHILYVQATKALVRLRRLAWAYVALWFISTNVSSTGSNQEIDRCTLYITFGNPHPDNSKTCVRLS